MCIKLIICRIDFVHGMVLKNNTTFIFALRKKSRRHLIIIIIIIIIIIYCIWVVTRRQWLFYMYTKHEIDYYQI